MKFYIIIGMSSPQASGYHLTSNNTSVSQRTLQVSSVDPDNSSSDGENECVGINVTSPSELSLLGEESNSYLHNTSDIGEASLPLDEQSKLAIESAETAETLPSTEEEFGDSQEHKEAFSTKGKYEESLEEESEKTFPSRSLSEQEYVRRLSSNFDNLFSEEAEYEDFSEEGFETCLISDFEENFLSQETEIEDSHHSEEEEDFEECLISNYDENFLSQETEIEDSHHPEEEDFEECLISDFEENIFSDGHNLNYEESLSSELENFEDCLPLQEDCEESLSSSNVVEPEENIKDNLSSEYLENLLTEVDDLLSENELEIKVEDSLSSEKEFEDALLSQEKENLPSLQSDFEMSLSSVEEGLKESLSSDENNLEVYFETLVDTRFEDVPSPVEEEESFISDYNPATLEFEGTLTEESVTTIKENVILHKIKLHAVEERIFITNCDPVISETIPVTKKNDETMPGTMKDGPNISSLEEECSRGSEETYTTLDKEQILTSSLGVEHSDDLASLGPYETGSNSLSTDEIPTELLTSDKICHTDFVTESSPSIRDSKEEIQVFSRSVYDAHSKHNIDFM